ncbi:ATP12 family chaperone protein [Euryhalocaulis caribicus]|uniref:ATP12 family chaperone protein n=1 Tax=Euryhalocaulis caribicus TaxID=1161401 RepID=UPI0003A2EE70|nr:ATP12 family protein [Euryhalocaulis caribicus]
MSKGFKRFYKHAEASDAEGGYNVLLDGKPMMTPDGAKLTLPTRAAAAQIADEWNAQGEQIKANDLPLTRLANLAQDRMGAAREATADWLTQYAQTDVLCHRAEHPQNLTQRQAEQWDAALEWANQELGVSLSTVCGIQTANHPPESLERVRDLALELDDLRLTGLAHAAGMMTSAVLAFALIRNRYSAEEAYALATLEEKFQQEQWGVDEAAAKRDAEILSELKTLQDFMNSL